MAFYQLEDGQSIFEIELYYFLRETVEVVKAAFYQKISGS